MTKTLAWYPFLLVASGIAFSAGPLQASSSDAAPAAQLPPGVAPVAYQLDLTIDPRREFFEGSVTIELVLEHATRQFWLHAQDLTVSRAMLTPSQGGAPVVAHLSQAADDGTARVTLDGEAQAGRATLTVQYTAPFNAGLEGIYVGTAAGERYVISQMEALGARRALPSFDEPRFKTPFTITVTAPTGMQVATNAPETGMQARAGGLIKHSFATTAPLPTYLLAFAVGPYDVLSGASVAPSGARRAPIAIRGFAARGKRQLLRTALDDAAKTLAYHEQYFGVPYPYGKLDLIAAPAYPSGAEENVAAIVFRESRLLIPDDVPREQWRAYFTTLTHEIAHEWMGDYVTPPWWEDVWLKEAFATWMQYKTAHVLAPSAAFDRTTISTALDAMELDTLASTRRIREPVHRNADVNTVYDSITYLKGAGVLAMLERYVGEERFRNGVRLYMSQYGNRTATSDEFFQALAQGSRDPKLVDSLRSFVDQPYVPWLEVRVDCSSSDRPIVRIDQSIYRPYGSKIESQQKWIVPLSLVYESKGARREMHALIEQPRTELPLTDQACPSWLLPNAGGSGYWRFELAQDAWRALIRAFPTLSAGEQLVTLDSLAASFRAGRVSAETYLAGLTAGLGAPSWDVALLAGRTLADGVATRAVPEAANASLAARIRELVGPRGRALLASGPQNPDEGVLRAQLARILVEADDAEVINTLGAGVARGDFALLDREPDLRAAIVTAAIKVHHGELPPGLLKAIVADPDQGRRADMLAGAGAGVSAAGSAPLLAAVLEHQVPAQELRPLLDQLMRNAGTRKFVWSWLTAQAEPLAQQYPVWIRSSVPDLGRYFCDMPSIEKLRGFFNAHGDLFPGYERSLALATESIQQCAALRSERGSELSAVWRR